MWNFRPVVMKTSKAMYYHIIDYWHSWFPTLPTYKNVNTRLNRLVDAYHLLLNLSMETFELSGDKRPILIGDSIAAANRAYHYLFS